jgi:hypothetical protein
MIDDRLPARVISGLSNALGATGSKLFQDLWNNSQVSIILEANPTYGGGTKTFNDPVTGALTIQIDPAQYPDAEPVNGVVYALQNYSQLAAVIGHELSHAELQFGNSDYISAVDPDAAVAIGERSEGEAYTAEYVIAEQLGDTGVFFGLNKLFGALNSDAKNSKNEGLDVSSITNAGILTASQFYADATGTSDLNTGAVSTVGNVGLAAASLHSPSSPDTAFTYQNRWQDQWVLYNVYGFTTGAPYSYSLRRLTHSSIQVLGNSSIGWTFTANNIPVSLNGVPLPSGGTLTSSNATLTFSGSEAGSGTKSPGTYIYSVPASGSTLAENLLYADAGSGNYTLNARNGTDWFFVQQLSTSSTGAVMIVPYSSWLGGLFGGSVSGAGGVLVDGASIGGSATAQLQSEPQAGPYHWSVDG